MIGCRRRADSARGPIPGGGPASLAWVRIEKRPRSRCAHAMACIVHTSGVHGRVAVGGLDAMTRPLAAARARETWEPGDGLAAVPTTLRAQAGPHAGAVVVAAAFVEIATEVRETSNHSRRASMESSCFVASMPWQGSSWARRESPRGSSNVALPAPAATSASRTHVLWNSAPRAMGRVGPRAETGKREAESGKRKAGSGASAPAAKAGPASRKRMPQQPFRQVAEVLQRRMPRG